MKRTKGISQSPLDTLIREHDQSEWKNKETQWEFTPEHSYDFAVSLRWKQPDGSPVVMKGGETWRFDNQTETAWRVYAGPSPDWNVEAWVSDWNEMEGYLDGRDYVTFVQGPKMTSEFCHGLLRGLTDETSQSNQEADDDTTGPRY